jgi:hypothetical protein
MENELLPCQKAVTLLFEILPSSTSGTMGIFLKAFKAQSKTMYKALSQDKKLQAELDQVFIKARNELNKIYSEKDNQ